jgi:putative Mg2+ transporter-C (MgtC) family protein
MDSSTLSAFFGQGWLQVGELLLAFALASLIGLERQLRGKSAGLRTQAIVGTTASLLLLVSKYGFSDVLVSGSVILDPSRVAAQIVSGVGFLGAGLILTRRGAVHGLTTAAAVWETAAIGMAAGAGLWELALIVTALHFLTTYGYTLISRTIPGAHDTALQVNLSYLDGQGILRQILAATTDRGWTVDRLATLETSDEGERRTVTIVLDISGPARSAPLVAELGSMDGILGVELLSRDELE